MTDQQRFFVDQPTQQLSSLSTNEDTQQERMMRLRRLKDLADATNRHFLHMYLEDERRRKGHQ